MHEGRGPSGRRSSGRTGLAWIVGLCFLFAPHTLFGLDPDRTLTQYVHRIWQMQQGLPQATIFSIWQTHDGYLWLGTQSGPMRFDGVRFTTPDEAGPLQNSWVRSLLEDDQHNLWIGTNESGLARLQNGVLKQYSAADGFPSAMVRCTIAGPKGDLWACTPEGMARFTGGKFVTYHTAQGLSTDNVWAACLARDGKVWIGGESSQLSVWNGTGFEAHPLASLPRDAAVRAMLCARDGAIWIGTTNGLIRLKDGTERHFTKAGGLAEDWIFTLSESRDGSLWVGTKDGFSRFIGGEFESFRTKDGLSQSSVHSIHEDGEGSLWVGTKHGLNQFLDGRTIPFTASSGLPSNDTGPVFQDHKGNIWVGTLDAGLARFTGRRFSVLTARQGLAGNAIRSLAEDAAGDLWVATDSGVNRLHDASVAQTFTRQQGLPANPVRCLFRDKHGALWAGTTAGPAVLQDGRFVQPAGSPRVPILAFGEQADQSLIMTTEGGGLVSYADGTFKEFHQAGLPPRDMDALFRDRDGNLWIGNLVGGLRLLKDGKIFNFRVLDGLFDDEIFGIAADDDDRLWMACSKGVFSVRRSDLLKFAAGTIRHFTSAPYSPMDALRTIECKSGVQPAVWKMKDGRLWFSTIRGLIVLDPNRMNRKLAAPPAAVEEVTVNGQREDPSRIENIPPGQKNLEFRYTGLSFVLPGALTFHYILEGFDKTWIDAGTRRDARYTNLPPGKFVFRLVACNVDGTCNPAASAVAFTLAPHYYQRAWFLLMCSGLVAALVWLAYRLRIRQLSDQFNMVLAERSRIARELHDTLIQGFSGVTMQMQALCARLTRSGEKETLEDVIQDATQCLREARRSVAGLRGARGPSSGLSAAIAEAARQITEARDVRLRLKLEQSPKDLSMDAEYNLLRIAQEALTNSLRHSGARTIEVSLNSTIESVRLAVKDDGCGFAAVKRDHPQPGHYGLIGMRERAGQIGAEFLLETELGRGTTVSVLLPRVAAGNGHRAPTKRPYIEENGVLDVTGQS